MQIPHNRSKQETNDINPLIATNSNVFEPNSYHENKS